jgi:hypothetical protein
MRSFYVSDGHAVVIIDARNEDDAVELCRAIGFDLIGGLGECSQQLTWKQPTRTRPQSAK